MKVKDLIEKLKDYPQDSEVLMQADYPWDDEYYLIKYPFKEIRLVIDGKDVECLVLGGEE